MSLWRRKALESFPGLRAELTQPRGEFSIYMLWFELLPMVRAAHRDGDSNRLA
jgi:hypothetical protein